MSLSGSAGGGVYIGDENSFVAVLANDDSGISAEDIEDMGMGFLGDEFIVITAYKGKV